MSELKSCPFCGDTDVVMHYTKFMDETLCWCTCNRCGIDMPAKNTIGEAVTTWNARHDKPRTRGHWTMDDMSGLVYCSVCNSDAPLEVMLGKQFKSKYCPNCGARMDKDDNK